MIGRTLESRKNPGSSFLGNLVMLVIIVTFFSVFMTREGTITLNATDEGLSIQMASGYAKSLAWDAVVSVEEREALDFGVMLDGTDTKKERSGAWENEEFGTYSLCTDATVTRCLVLHTRDGVVVVNFESNESTHSLGAAILELLESE